MRRERRPEQRRAFPVTELLIEPDFGRKTARFRGAVAAGEKVKVTVAGGAAVRSDTLRLRLCEAHTGETLAVFPLPSPDGETQPTWQKTGEDATCTLNLNTVQMRLRARWLGCGCAVTAALDDPGLETVHFIGTMDVLGWSGDPGGDGPYDLSEFPGLIEGWTRRMAAMELSAVKDGDTVTISAWDGSGDRPQPVTVRDGASAYEVARRNGFDGTEEQWLASLKLSDEQLASITSDIAENRSRLTEADENLSATMSRVVDLLSSLDSEIFQRESHEADKSNPHGVTAAQAGALSLNGGGIAWVVDDTKLSITKPVIFEADSSSKGVLARIENNGWQDSDGAYPKDAREEVLGMIDAAVGDVNAALEGVA